ncbi:glycosyltransferase [Winogradskyella flava]|uniref:Glycosyltransferase n=1 Tax=Winogradskyella flava TaxID=1884876 RepID=A0A842IQ43_9FLAO|nr:glycosyltransferase [Winogradskyella flava]MBC2844921.1 glycosyltransferase [Winogradskyella flava]
MRLSILISMYNAKSHIGNCIESLLNQNLSKEDYEIIIMDDGSTDDSYSIVQNYQGKYGNIKLFTQENSGLYTTRNKLLKLAQGDYIYNLDSDDYIVHNCLNELLSIAEENDLEIIGFDTLETFSLDLTGLAKPISSYKTDLCSGVEFIENYPKLRHEVWWYFTKREFIQKHKLFFNKNEYNADVVFTLKTLLPAKSIGYIPVSIHRYVQTQDSLMRSENMEIVINRFEYMQMMILNKSKLIINLENNDQHSDILIDNLKHRRDVFTFFSIINYIRNHFSLAFIRTKIGQLKAVNAYPVSNFNKYSFNTLLHNVVLRVINSERILYGLIYLKNLFVKKSDKL